MHRLLIAVEAGEVTFAVDRGQAGCSSSREVDRRELSLAQQKPVKTLVVITARLESAIAADNIAVNINPWISRYRIPRLEGARNINRRQLALVEQVHMKLPVGAHIPSDDLAVGIDLSGARVSSETCRHQDGCERATT